MQHFGQYLGVVGRALPVSDGVASAIAGWDPDQTYWLTDVLSNATDAEEWSEGRDGEWSRTSGR